MSKKAPGKSHRAGMTLLQLMERFPTEESAAEWFESVFWGGRRCCGHCGSLNTHETPKRKPQPYRCRECRKYFSVRTGTLLESSRVPLRKWVIAIYLCLTSLKGVSSMKLHRDIGVTQKTAWFMIHRIREAWADQGEDNDDFSGPVEVDETFFGGKRANMSNAKRKELAGTGRGAVGKVAVAGVKDRESNKVSAQVVEAVDSDTMIPFVEDRVAHGATVYTDDAKAYKPLPTMLNGYDHETVIHSLMEYVRGPIHTNGVESFWSMLKRAHKGTFHKMSPKHLNRYIQEFVARHNMRESGTVEQMSETVARFVGKRLMYRRLIAYNGLSSAARTH